MAQVRAAKEKVKMLNGYYAAASAGYVAGYTAVAGHTPGEGPNDFSEDERTDVTRGIDQALECISGPCQQLESITNTIRVKRDQLKR